MLEMAAAVIGSLGTDQRCISCILGQDIGKFAITEAITDMGDIENPRETEMFVGERNNGMNCINDSSADHKWIVLRFGSKGSLAAWSRMAE